MKKEMRKKLRKHYAVDILLGNWDVLGVNKLIDSKGTPWRIGNSGAMGLTAQGLKKPDASWNINAQKSACFDDLWTMTNNGARIGINTGTADFKGYFGAVDVLDMVDEISSTDWKEGLKRLSKSDRVAVKLRVREAKRLAARANRQMSYEDMNVYPRETVLKTMDYNYQWRKLDIWKEVANVEVKDKIDVNGQTISGIYNTDKRKMFVAKYENNTNLTPVGEYLKNFIGADEWDFIQSCNESQGNHSYKLDSCKRKMCVLKNQGHDCTKFATPSDFIQEVENAGYFTGVPNKDPGQVNFIKAFDFFRDPINSGELDSLSDACLKYDAFIQLVLEKANIQGYDKGNGTMILVRTEDETVVCDGNKIPLNNPNTTLKNGDLTHHRRGVAESHSHIRQVEVLGNRLTVVRVPASRIHAFWFNERYQCGSGKYKVRQKDTMLLKAKENEFVADTHGLDCVYVGKASDGERVAQAVTVLENYEKNKKP